SVILFADDLPEFLKGFDESLRVLEKAEREKKRGRGRTPPRGEPDRENGRAAGSFRPDRNRGSGPDRDRGHRTGEEGGHKRVVIREKKNRRPEP
ncbi:MAG: hypothetical protein LBU21_06485, partial [Treponema sp.]|nr:hypothetical protein [Treponema sp.]